MDRGGRGFEHRLARKDMRDERGGGSSVPGTGRRRVSLVVPALCSPCSPATAHRWLFPLSFQERVWGGAVREL